MTFEVEVGGRLRVVDLTLGSGGYEAVIDGRKTRADVLRIGDRWSMLLDHRSYEVAISHRRAGGIVAYVNGYPVPLSVTASGHRQRGERIAGPEEVKAPRATTAPMPGKIVKVLVRIGDTVVARQGLVVIEAMKMENELRSVRAGLVTDVNVTEGMLVEVGAVLVVVE